MSARNYSDRRYSLERDVVDIFLRGTGANAANLTNVKGKGIASITRTGAGAHTITLSDNYNGMLMFQAMVIDPTGPVGWDVICTQDLSSKTVKLAIFNVAGVATDLSPDEKLLVKMTFSNSVQTPLGY